MSRLAVLVLLAGVGGLALATGLLAGELPRSARTSTGARTRDPTGGLASAQADQRPEILRLPATQAAAAGHAPALPSGPFTLAALEQMGLANNPTIRAARQRVAAARGEWLQVGLRPNPTVGYVGTEIGNEDRGGQQGAFVGNEIVRGGKLQLNRAVAAQTIRQAEERLAAQQFRVLSDVRLSFYDVLTAQKTVEFTRELLRINDRVVNLAEEFLRAKEGTRVDLLQARVERNTIAIALANAQNRHEAAWRTMAAIVGQPSLPLGVLEGDLTEDEHELDYESVLAELSLSSPELRAARAAIERTRSAIARAEAEPIPNIQWQSYWQYDLATNDPIASVQVGVPLPIRNWNQGGIRKACAEFQVAQADYQRVELDLNRRLAETWERLANARQQVQRYQEEILPDAQESLKLVTEGYTQGEFSFLSVLTAQRTFVQTNLAYLASLRQLRTAVAEIDGMLLRDSLSDGGAPDARRAPDADGPSATIRYPGRPE
jgi:cobalt-zinc-cadmium efflux system outer membrane protein